MNEPERYTFSMFDWLFKPSGGKPAAFEPAAAEARVRAGLEHHRAGRLREAQAEYAGALALDPENIDALHFSGVVAHQHGRHEEASRLIARALARNAANPPAH